MAPSVAESQLLHYSRWWQLGSADYNYQAIVAPLSKTIEKSRSEQLNFHYLPPKMILAAEIMNIEAFSSTTTCWMVSDVHSYEVVEEILLWED